MIKIDDTNPLKGYAGIKKKLKTAGTGSTSFADVLTAAGAASEAATEVSSVSAGASVDGLLSLQEVSDEDFARQKTIKQGHDLLKSLEALRQSLLLGAVPYDVLRTLEGRLKEQRAQTVDPELHLIMDDIELRAAVELAKYNQ